MNSPMWLTSNNPAFWRTALCSMVIPVGYCTGISNPANGTILAPRATWVSWSGVRFSGRREARGERRSPTEASRAGWGGSPLIDVLVTSVMGRVAVVDPICAKHSEIWSPARDNLAETQNKRRPSDRCAPYHSSLRSRLSSPERFALRHHLPGRNLAYLAHVYP